MIFNTAWFWPYLILALLALAVTPIRARKWVALLACATFHYHYAGRAGMLPVIALGVAVYGLSRIRKKSLKLGALFGILLCVGTLVYAKYLAYFASLLHQDWKLGAIPLGISFFTFEFVHYLVEVEHGGKPIQNPLDFGLFSIFFPSLVAGPIKRYPDFTAQLKRSDAFRPTPESIVSGGTRMAIGAGKKLLLADPLANLCDQIHQQFLSQGLEPGRAWFLLVALALRIYLDFSGYSDMAIGAARMLNIRIPENFNWPYVSRSLQEFWRRWHISLSEWIRDYVYIPLGGSRVSAPRKLFNFLLAFGLCGLWHGADNHFVVWGLWHGAGLGAERMAMSQSWGKSLFESRWGWALTFLFVCLGWLLFFYPVDEAGRIALSLVGMRGGA